VVVNDEEEHAYTMLLMSSSVPSPHPLTSRSLLLLIHYEITVYISSRSRLELNTRRELSSLVKYQLLYDKQTQCILHEDNFLKFPKYYRNFLDKFRQCLKKIPVLLNKKNKLLQ